MLLFSPDFMHVEKRFDLSFEGVQIELKIYKGGRNKTEVIQLMFLFA